MTAFSPATFAAGAQQLFDAALADLNSAGGLLAAVECFTADGAHPLTLIPAASHLTVRRNVTADREILAVPMPRRGQPAPQVTAAFARTKTVAALAVGTGSLTAESRAAREPDTLTVVGFWPQQDVAVLLAGRIAGPTAQRHLDGDPVRLTGAAVLNSRVGDAFRWLADLLPQFDGN